MKKTFFLKSLTMEVNLNKITSIIGNSKEIVISLLKDQYQLVSIDNLFNKENKLVSKMIPNSQKGLEIIKILNLKPILNKYYNDLGVEDKCLVNLAIYLPTIKDFIILDDIISYLNETKKIKVLKYLKDQKITVLNFTSDIEETLLGDDIIVLDNNKIVLSGDKTDVLKNEKLLKNLGLYLPFIIDISIQLNLYGLINKIYLDSKKLLGDLWK